MNTTPINSHLKSVPASTPLKFIRIRKTLELSGLSRTSLYRKMVAGIFVPTISLGERSCAHIESEVNAMLAAMAVGKNEDELKALVKTLVEQRQQLAA
jgi:prophage regulatory protein